MLALEARSLSKTYRTLLTRQAPPALCDVGLAVPQGARVALMGANGSGKTTLLKLFATLLRPSQGEVRLMGRDTAREVRAARRQMVFVPGEGRGLYPRLTGRQNAVFFAALYGLSEAQVAKSLQDLVEPWGLAELIDRPVQQLSTGERQRLAMALALVPEPAVLLLDEPTRSLDPRQASAVWPLLTANAERTVLWASHAPEECFAVADALVVLQRGRVVQQGSPAQVAPAGMASLAEWYR
jgi:ABC-2 type transport system ATP-binding protein